MRRERINMAVRGMVDQKSKTVTVSYDRERMVVLPNGLVVPYSEYKQDINGYLCRN